MFYTLCYTLYIESVSFVYSEYSVCTPLSLISITFELYFIYCTFNAEVPFAGVHWSSIFYINSLCVLYYQVYQTKVTHLPDFNRCSTVNLSKTIVYIWCMHHISCFQWCNLPVIQHPMMYTQVFPSVCKLTCLHFSSIFVTVYNYHLHCALNTLLCNVLWSFALHCIMYSDCIHFADCMQYDII